MEESTLRELFSDKGAVTDVQLKFTKDGKFRQFAFVGFATEDAAREAIKFHDKTFIKTSRISVELCNDLASKFTEAEKEQAERAKQEEAKKKPSTKVKDQIKELLAKYKDDPLFQEFLNTHMKNKEIWRDDTGTTDLLEKQYKEMVAAAKTSKKSEQKEATKESLEKKDEVKKSMVQLYTVKLKNIPKNTKRQDVLKFFKPLKPHSVRIPGLKMRFAYAGFKTKQELNKALLKDKSFFNGKQIEIIDFTKKNEKTKEEKEKTGVDKKGNKWNQQTQSLEGEEDICESGKLFFRNLSYSVNEAILQELFEKYGPVSEINVPIDSITRKIKGFGTVVFLMPEHAVRAYNELNGTQFHGRMFHLIPGKSDDKPDETDDAGTNFKKAKQEKLKKTAGSSHNWNTLFLGPNAVAEVMAKKYGKTKEEVLDTQSGGSSAAVRLALGETQIVIEMKQFLEENGVCLQSFEGVPQKRSKTVLLAKNLPAGTTAEEMKNMFVKFGVLGRVLLPPSGVTCIIEFTEPTEARKAFKGLAYKMFKGQPLYLEWAPEDTFNSAVKPPTEKQVTDEKKTNEDVPQEVKKIESKSISEPIEVEHEKEEVDDTPPEPNTTLFIKNLNFTTREPAIREHFKKIGPIHSIQVAMKKDPNNPEQRTSLGYGFIQFKTQKAFDAALKNLQFSTLEGNKIELKRSDRTLATDVTTARKTVKSSSQTGTKILIRNIPFQAKESEIRDVFKVFGEIRALRLPKKFNSDTHRGFGFVDFFTKEEAKQAFETLSTSVHLYGRRLVLEWALEEGIEELRKRTADHFAAGSGSISKRPKAVFNVTDTTVNGEEGDD